MPRSRSVFRIGNYFLGKRPNSEQWCACWYSARARQTIRRSLRTKDFLTAQIELARFVARHADIRNADPASLTVAQVLERYWHHHAKDLPSADQARIAGRILVEHFEGAAVAELTPARQQQFIAAMRAAGRSGGNIPRLLSVLRAAVNRAHRHGEITAAPFIMDVKKGEARDRVLTKDEIALLWQAADEPHLRMFLILALNTGARPNAILARRGLTSTSIVGC